MAMIAASWGSLCVRGRDHCVPHKDGKRKEWKKVTKWRMSVRCFTMRQTAHVDAWRVAIVEMDGVRSLDSIVESSLFIELCLFKEGVSEIQTLQVRREKKKKQQKKKEKRIRKE